jgi:ferredoxin--NADP+ reductase
MTETAASTTEPKYTRQTVISTRHWASEKLFSVRATRDSAFKFSPGQFARLGLAILPSEPQTPEEWRAYSMVSHPDEDVLEFFSVVVSEGKFSPAFARLQPGDPLWVDKTSFGFLTLDRFTDGEDLWLIATGTGLSAYLSMLHDPQTWLRFKSIVLVHGVQYSNELAYRDEILRIGAMHAPNQLRYIPVTSQEHTAPELSPALKYLTAPARITTLLADGELEHRIGIALDTSRSRIMLCGNPAMVTEMRALLTNKGFAAGRRGIAGNLAVENYW